ncbi:MAG: hypothetical protein IJL62_01840 [Clostridia bacterium]|nr:hypothetical protein [Clostridia bacterium]
MSTDRKKKKRGFPRVERVKIIEYVCIGLVILLFLGLAVFYGGRRVNPSAADAETSPSPAPTDDLSIRGMNLLNALDRAGFDVAYQTDRYDVKTSDDVAFDMRMESDDKGIVRLSFETLLCADPDDGTETANVIRAENKQTVAALRELFDCVMPVFRRTIADSDTIVKQCQKVAETGEPYSKHFGKYSVRISSDPSSVPQTVVILFVRDP